MLCMQNVFTPTWFMWILNLCKCREMEQQQITKKCLYGWREYDKGWCKLSFFSSAFFSCFSVCHSVHLSLFAENKFHGWLAAGNRNESASVTSKGQNLTCKKREIERWTDRDRGTCFQSTRILLYTSSFNLYSGLGK